MSTNGRRLRCLLISPADPLTRRPRAGPLRRLLHPPPGISYLHATDRVAIPTSTGQYGFTPVNIGLSALKFAVEHSFPLDQSKADIAHTFFWDVRKFTVPWVHESDQSLGQFLGGYTNIGGFVRRVSTEGYSSYLNSRGCAGVVTWTEWAKKGFVEDGVDKERIFVVPPPFGTISDAKGHEGCNILFLGRDYFRKGGDLMLRTFRSVDSPGVSLRYVGKAGSGAAGLIERDSRIVYQEAPSIGVLERDIWPVVDIFALPTRADAFAMTIVEAMSRGIPVVASALPSIAEVVEDGVSGFLFRVGDNAKFLDSLNRLAVDGSLRRKIGAAARERVKTLFSPSSVGKRLLEVYRRA
jgi:glycosyltransferase involved in cell wall biosynthesis